MFLHTHDITKIMFAPSYVILCNVHIPLIYAIYVRVMIKTLNKINCGYPFVVHLCAHLRNMLQFFLLLLWQDACFYKRCERQHIKSIDFLFFRKENEISIVWRVCIYVQNYFFFIMQNCTHPLFTIIILCYG